MSELPLNAKILKENDVILENKYFPKSGGALTSAKALRREIDDSLLQISGGTSDESAFINLFGKDNPSVNTCGFEIQAGGAHSTTKSILNGRPGGLLTWNGNDLAGSAIVAKSLGTNKYIKYASGLIIQYINIIPTGGTIDFPIQFNGIPVVMCSYHGGDISSDNIKIKTVTNTSFTVTSSVSYLGIKAIAIGY